MSRLSYDVVIIGSGMGGMSAAALLTLAGYRTLVVERLPFLGGRATAYDYKGFKLSTGAMSFPTYDESPVTQVFRMIGAEYNIRPLLGEHVFQYRIRGTDYDISRKEGLRGLISLAGDNKEEVERVTSAVERALSWQEPSTTITLQEWLSQFTHNNTIFQIFQQVCVGHLGINIHEVPAAELFRYLKHAIITQVRGYAPEGNQALMESLRKAIQDKGGDLWTHSRAKHIVVQDRQAKGLVVQRAGEEIEIEAKAVISNAGPRRTVELAGNENFDIGYMKEIRERLRPAYHILFFIAMPGDRPLPARLYLTDIRRLFAIRCMTMTCPELAPPGKHLIYASAVPGSSMPPINFRHEIELCLLDLKENLPGFDRYGEILRIHRFRGDWPFYHTWPGYEVPIKTPIENLYNVGDGVKPPSWIGLEACVESARIVADDIKERIGRS